MALVRPWMAVVAAAILFHFGVGEARGQEMEPRGYAASPIDTNFLIASYLRTTGSISLDPALPITGVTAAINTGALAYDRTFDLFGRTASAAIVVPYFQGVLNGEVLGEGATVSRSGLGDIGLRLSENLIGNPALSPEQFAQRTPTTTVGTSLTIRTPTGDYNPTHLANIGTNRWAIKPEIGLSQPIGGWFVDAAAGVWLFTDNGNFFQGRVRGQTPLLVVQGGGGYEFRTSLWLAANVVYYSGGETSINGIPGQNAQTVARYGLTLSVPIAGGLAVKFNWSTWLIAHNGGTYNTIGAVLQYRWFDR